MGIVCYIGKSNTNVDIIEEMIESGMTMGRFNFKNDPEGTKSAIKEIQNRHLPLEILYDIEGNKFRVSGLIKSEIEINKGDFVCFCTETYYPELLKIAPDTIIIPLAYEMTNLSFDTIKNFKVESSDKSFSFVDGSDAFALTVASHSITLKPHQGINPIGVDGTNYEYIGLTDIDKYDIIWCLDNNVHILCLSYCDNKERVYELKKFIKKHLKKGSQFPVIYGKTETAEGIRNYDEVLKEVDGIMLGRGDLSLEVPFTEICVKEKDLIIKANTCGKKFILATHVLGSMGGSLICTFAEENAITCEVQYGNFEFMLSKEVGDGLYPVNTVKTMRRILSSLQSL